MQVASDLFKLLFLAAVISVVSGCVPQSGGVKKTSIELQAFQAKEFNTTVKTAFASTLSVFQDLGYTVQSASLDTGFITAKSPTNQSYSLFIGKEMQEVRATAFIEPIAEERSRIRLSFVDNVQTSSDYGMQGESETPIEDPVFYQEAFKKIQKAIFVRTNLE